MPSAASNGLNLRLRIMFRSQDVPLRVAKSSRRSFGCHETRSPFKCTHAREDGDKITFVADDGGKSWDVVNPETLKDHVGHHVELNAHVNKDKGEIHVMF